jgi:hypothetical protein
MKTNFTADEIYDRYVAPGTTYAEIEAMDRETITRQVGELRDASDDPDLSDELIAEMIIRYAHSSLMLGL